MFRQLKPISIALLLSLSACSSKPSVKTPEVPLVPARPWQKVALKGVTQTSLKAFGIRIVVRAWPSTVTPSTTNALLDAVTEIKRLESMVEPSNESSEIAKINRESFNGPVQISEELAQILIDCNRMHQLSEGKFDITYVPHKTENELADDDINKIMDWDAQPKLSPNPQHLMGAKSLLLDQNPPRLRRFNRRNRLNLNGMIRGYAIDRVSKVLATQKLAGFAVIADGLFSAAGVALSDPGLMCVENPNALGKCIKRIRAAEPNRIFYGGTSASLERRGQMFDPTSTLSYRSGGVIVAGSTAKWVQFALTYGAIADEGRMNTLFDKKNGLNLSGTYFDQTDKTKLIGSLAPYASIID